MEYLVCQMKDESKMLFITTRKSRETLLSVLIDLGQEVESVVLKSFSDYSSADKYKKEIEAVNKKISDL